MKLSWILFRVLLCAVALEGGLGCGGALDYARPHARNPRYALGYANATGAEINNIGLDWSVDGVAFHDGTGGLAARGSGQNSEAPDPIPPKATLSWETTDGQKHRQELEVASRVPDLANFSGTVWFKIMPDGSVRLVPLTTEEMEQRAIAGKPIP